MLQLLPAQLQQGLNTFSLRTVEEVETPVVEAKATKKKRAAKK